MSDDNLIQQLSTLNPRQLGDLLQALEHNRQQTARADGVDALTAMFEYGNRDAQDLIDGLDAIASSEDGEQA